jgi:hypothetical protein
VHGVLVTFLSEIGLVWFPRILETVRLLVTRSNVSLDSSEFLAQSSGVGFINYFYLIQ